MIYPNVYTVHEENSHRFYQLPKELFVNEKYKTLSSDAKLLYALLLDRKELSRSNDWVDENGQVYLIYSRESIMEILNISKNTATKIFKELTKSNLIIEERQGLNKPNKIYVCRIEYSSTNGSTKLGSQETHKLSPNDTEYSETEKNNKRYIITSNDACVFSFYSKAYKEYTGKDHPTVTKEQLDRLDYDFQHIDCTLDIFHEETWGDLIHHHFLNLSPTNNGSIFSFLVEGVIYRYLQEME